jgi:hypothetical protein
MDSSWLQPLAPKVIASAAAHTTLAAPARRARAGGRTRGCGSLEPHQSRVIIGGPFGPLPGSEPRPRGSPSASTPRGGVLSSQYFPGPGDEVSEHVRRLSSASDDPPGPTADGRTMRSRTKFVGGPLLALATTWLRDRARHFVVRRRFATTPNGTNGPARRRSMVIPARGDVPRTTSRRRRPMEEAEGPRRLGSR